jgi:hypothetical protein
LSDEISTSLVKHSRYYSSPKAAHAKRVNATVWKLHLWRGHWPVKPPSSQDRVSSGSACTLQPAGINHTKCYILYRSHRAVPLIAPGTQSNKTHTCYV